MVIVVTLTVRRDELAAFRAHERNAARVMERHGGRIERVVTIEGEGGGETIREVHVVRFADRAAFAAYQKDPELAVTATLRAQAVVATEALFGDDGPDYHQAN